MKIDRSSLHAPTPTRRGERARGSDGGFADALGGGDAPQGAAGAPSAQMTGLDALLALQDVQQAPGGREEEARSQGERILDRLEELRMDLLDGRLTGASVQRLSAEVDAARAESDDPRLNDILDEIELRAHVELAKLGL